MTMNDVMELTIPQLEYILEGCKKNSEELEKEIKNGNKSETIVGADAIQYLAQQGEVTGR